MEMRLSLLSPSVGPSRQIRHLIEHRGKVDVVVADALDQAVQAVTQGDAKRATGMERHPEPPLGAQVMERQVDQ